MEDELTTAERRVAMYIRKGWRAKEIAEDWRPLDDPKGPASRHTINALTARLMKKIGVNRRAQVAVWADRLERQEIASRVAAEIEEIAPHKDSARELKRAEKV